MTTNRIVKHGSLLLFLAVNVVIAAVTITAALLTWRSYRLAFQGEKAPGRVTALVQTMDNEGDCCLYSPLVEYQVNGRTMEVIGRGASTHPSYKVGQDIEVLYDPMDYSNAVLNTFSELWIMPTILGTTAAVLFVTLNFVAITGLFVARRNG